MQIVLAVYDEKALSYGNPMFVVNEGVAVRSFCDAAADPKSYIAAHPGDYKLYKIGTYEENTGELRNLAPKVLVMSGTNAIALAGIAPAAGVRKLTNAPKEVAK